MYCIKIEENRAALEMVVARGLLTSSALACMVVRHGSYVAVNWLSAVLLLLSAFFIRHLYLQLRVHPLAVFGVAALLVLFSTGSVIFAGLLFAIHFATTFIYEPPTITFTEEGILVEKSLSTVKHLWPAMNNVVLKDGLLTLDFASNKMLQLSVAVASLTTDETGFNEFCRQQLARQNVNLGK